MRDQIVDSIKKWSKKTLIPTSKLLKWLKLSPKKYYSWIKRYGKINNHNRLIPRDFWITSKEKEAIIEFAKNNPLEGYRRLTYMMIDSDIAAVSLATTYRILKSEGLIGNKNGNPSSKGTGFVQPLEPHQHWHTDFSYINITGTFYYLCCVLDGCSRYIVEWDIRESMKVSDAQIVIQPAFEKYFQDKLKPRIISDRGAQYTSREFKDFIRHWQCYHVLTSPYYPQSNGKIESFHKTIKAAAIRPKTPLSLDDAKRVAGEFIEFYNNTRLHSGDRLCCTN